MESIIDEMKKYTDEELKLLGHGILSDLNQNTAVFHKWPTITQFAAKITNEVFPFPKDVDAFQLTPQQIYFRARTVQLLVEFLRSQKEEK